MIIDYKKYKKSMTVIAVGLLILTGFIFSTLTGFADTERHTYVEVEKMALLGAIKANNMQEAEIILKDYLATNPDYISELLYNELGHVYLAQKKYDEALNILEQGHEAYPENEGVNIKIYDNFHDRKSLREKGVCSGLLESDNLKGIQIYRLFEVDVPPTIIKRAPLQYPAKALEEGITGKVVLCYVVTKEGTVGDILIGKSEPEGIFDESALEYIKQYLFKPAVKDGKPVNVLIPDLVKFNLK